MAMLGIRWVAMLAILGFLPLPGMAQYTNPPEAARSGWPDLGVASRVRLAELPPAGQPEQPGAPIDESVRPAALTLAQLEEQAVRCNPTLAQAAAQVQAARGRYLQAGLYPNPIAGYQATEIGDEGQAGQQGGFIGQEIVTNGKLRLNRAVAGQEIQQAECLWQTQRLRVLTDVRRAYYEAIITQRSVELAEQLVAIGQQGVAATEALIEAKEVARVDLLQARVEADSAKLLLEKSRNRHAAAWRGLAAVVGDPLAQPTPLAGDPRDSLPEFAWADTLERLYVESPQLAAAQAGIARAQATLNRECAERIPNVDVQLGMQYDNATQDNITGVQVGIPLPLFNRNQGNIQRARAELSAAYREVERVRLSLQQRLAVVFEQYATARQQVERYANDILPNAEESLKLVSSGYRQGEFGYVMLLTAQRTYFQTHLAFLEAQRDLRAAAATIEGNLLTDSLEVASQGERIER